MALTNETSWTNRTMDMLRSNPRIDDKTILKKLIPDTLKKGFRFVSQQSEPTEGVRPLRLDAWYYIRRLQVDDVLKALQESGYSSEPLRQQIRESMESQKVYHTAVRGNDPKFMPGGIQDGQDTVTNFVCEQLELVHEEVDKYLFDESGDHQAVQQAMSDPNFDSMLELYFLGGDIRSEETLHVVSRFREGGNLLHTCIKEGYVETLRLLLDRYTFESHGQRARWRVLAEPLRPCGQYKCSAFHRAVYDGQEKCLEELVAWAQKHNHDIKELHNSEERSLVGETVRGLTSLELAEQEGNWACYNILAPLFGVPAKDAAVDTNPRAARLALRCTPRVELSVEGEATTLKTIELTSSGWMEVLDAVKSMRSCEECRSNDLGRFIVRVCSVAFLSDPTDVDLDGLLAASEGMRAIETESCTMNTDRTGLVCLRAVVNRLGAAVVGLLPPCMPHKVNIAASAVEELPAEEEALVDVEVGQLMIRLVELCGRWPGFLDARNGLISKKQRLRLAKSQNFTALSASWASVYATRLASFLGHCRPGHEEHDLESWLRKQELMPLTRAVFKHFFNMQKLLSSEFDDLCLALHPAVVQFLEMTLLAWFALCPREGSDDAWKLWAERLGGDEDILKQQLAPALDNVLEGLLRMWKVLNPVFRSAVSVGTANAKSIGELIRNVVPDLLLDRLPNTRRRLEDNYGSNSVTPQVALTTTRRISLTATSGSLRPGGLLARR